MVCLLGAGILGCTNPASDAPGGLGPVQGLSPSGGVTLADRDPVLTWNPVAGASAYEVQATGTEGDLGGAEAVLVQDACQWQPPELPRASALFWRVRALPAAGGPGPWSPTAVFHVSWGALGNPIPAPRGAVYSHHPTVSWEAVPGAAGYEVALAQDSAALASAPPVAVTDPSWTVATSLTFGQSYVWRVRAVSASQGTDGWSRDLPLNAEVGLVDRLTPELGTSTTDTTPRLSWQPAPGATAYQMQTASTELGLLSADPLDLTEAQFVPSRPLANGQTLFWRIRAIDGAGGPGPWSVPSSFLLNWGTSGPADGIRFPEELQALNEGELLKGSYVLGDDLDLTGQSWTPLGTASQPFVGTLDGRGHTIRGYRSSGPQNAWGLFARIGTGGVVKDLNLEATLAPSGRDSYNWGTGAGALADRCAGTVTGCSVTADVQAVWVAGIGSLVGVLEETGTVSDCASAGTVGASPGNQVGGLVGESKGVILRSRADVTVAGTGQDFGGLVGLLWHRVEDSSATGAVTADVSTGGLVGRFSGQTEAAAVLRSWATGTVKGVGMVGGLVGASGSWGRVAESWASGDVEDTSTSGSSSVGGLIGSSSVVVADCFARGSVTGRSDYNAGGSWGIGGLVGYAGQRVERCYSTGRVTNTAGASGSGTGGLVGVNYAGIQVSASFYDTETSNQSGTNGGTPKLTASLMVPGTFTAAGWDWVGEAANGTADLWTLDPQLTINDGYPYLRAVPPQ